MKKNILALSLGLGLFTFGCQSNAEKKEAKQETPKEEFAIDWHSKSNSLKINPQHVSLDIEVDFDNHQIVGSSKWFLKPEEGTEKAIFDTYQLQIDSILYADGSKANFKLGAHDEILGAALEVDLQENTEELTIRSEEHTSELQSRGHLVC